MRSFIAIGLPQEVKDALTDIQQKLKKTQVDAKWVKPENLHLTLKFLGDINDNQLHNIKIILKEAANNQGVFTASISTLGAFPKIIYPRIIWAGLKKGVQEAEKIAKELEERIAKIGIPKEKKGFSSHITLARIKSNLNKNNLIEELNRLTLNFPEGLEFKVAKIDLMKSTLSTKEPIYEILEEAYLRTT